MAESQMSLRTDGVVIAIKVMDIDPEPLVLNGHNYYLQTYEVLRFSRQKSDELSNV